MSLPAGAGNGTPQTLRKRVLFFQRVDPVFLQVFITPYPVLRFMERLGDPTLKTLTKAVDTMRASMLGVIHVRQ